MSKTITVPDIGMYPIEVTVNETKYKLTPGATATVPDGVAALLLGIAENKPRPAEDGYLDQNATLRDVKRMIEESGGDEPSVGDVYSVTFTLTSASTGTADKDFDDITTAFSQGETVLVHIPVPGETRLGFSYVVTSINGGRIYGVTIDDDENLAAVISDRVSGDSYSFMLKGIPEKVKPTYEFGFTVTAGQTAGTFVATPDTGVTYAAISAALAETPNVYAVLDLGFNDQIIRALFSVDSTASGAESTSALALFYDGTKFQAARLMVSADGASIVIKDT